MYRQALDAEEAEGSAPQQRGDLWVRAGGPPREPPPAVELFLDHHREPLNRLFYDLREQAAFSGLMANSRPEQLIDMVLDCCRFAILEVPSSSSDEEDGEGDDDDFPIIDRREQMFDYT